MRLSGILPVGLGVLLTACGGGGRSPVSPSGTASDTATGLRIAGPDAVLTGYSEKYDATATLSNGGTINQATATWNTDDAGVATINSNGVLRGQRPGTATITAMYRGATATKSVQVLAKPASKAFPARANLVISYRPDPVQGSVTGCPNPDPGTPTWSYSLVITETGGVGFNLKTYTWNLYNESGSFFYGGPEDEEQYFAPDSVFVEEVCHSLLGVPSGTTEDIMDGVDDNGNQLRFSNRLRLLPVAPVSSTSSLIAPNPIAPGVFRLLHRVR